MQKIIFLLSAITLLFSSPSLVGAQSPETVLEELTIQVWPEYDQPKVLVIYNFKVAPTVLPVTVQIRFSGEAELFAVAQYTDQGLMTATYDSLAVEGGYSVLTMTLTELSVYHIEYYVPLERRGNLRLYSLDWPGDYEVNLLDVLIQKPIGARNLKTDPELLEMPGSDGFIYAQGQFENLPAGQAFSVAFEYEKDDESLSIANLSASINGTLDAAQGSTFPLTSTLPWLLGGFGAALIVGGVLWFWYSGRGRKESQDSSRKRHSNRAESGGDGQVYCSQCGKRSENSDRFCRACGARLRR